MPILKKAFDLPWGCGTVVSVTHFNVRDVSSNAAEGKSFDHCCFCCKRTKIDQKEFRAGPNLKTSNYYYNPSFNFGQKIFCAPNVPTYCYCLNFISLFVANESIGKYN